MRCEDCLPLIEEYFDGEVAESAAARMGAHLAACETCAAALDALSFEQEIYARYDRGLEAGPDLWARVSAEIAREPRAEIPAAPRPFLGRARERFATAFGAAAWRPALASSMAVLLIAAAAGSLWLARRSPKTPGAEVAENVPAAPAALTPPAPVKGEDVVAPSPEIL
ncbi:MAG TPA: zf-HC2 domain-containing protein, partial [Pyrinomonadaceae bacterium]